MTQFDIYKSKKETRYTIKIGKASIRSCKEGPAKRLQMSIMGIETFIINLDIALSEVSSKILHLTQRIPMDTKKVKIKSC